MIALARERSTWLLGYQDETWWSRVARPALSAWGEPTQPLRLVNVAVPAGDPAPKALACYGLWLPERGETWLRFVDGRPVSALTIDDLISQGTSERSPTLRLAVCASCGKTTMWTVNLDEVRESGHFSRTTVRAKGGDGEDAPRLEDRDDESHDGELLAEPDVLPDVPDAPPAPEGDADAGDKDV